MSDDEIGEMTQIKMRKPIASLVLAALWMVAAAQAQGPAPAAQATAQGGLTVEQAVELARTNYPELRAAGARVSAAQAGIGLARTAYLPRTDLLWQANRATRNNVFGLLLPQPVIPSISGPVLGTTALSDSVWGSAAGALFAWQPFDFGARAAGVRVAEATREQASAEFDAARLEVTTAAADAFLSLLAAQQRVAAANASVDRMQVFLESVRALVRSQLRPGVEESRATAELAAARTQLIQAEQAEEVARIALAQAIGRAPGDPLPVVPGRLLALPSGTEAQNLPVNRGAHPLLRAETAAVDVIRAREHALDRSWYPRFEFQSALFARGTGARTDGGLLGGANGLAPDVPNWAAGITVTLPLFDFASIKARKQVESFNERAESARYDQAVLALDSQAARARALLDAARRIEQNAPLQVEAAQAAERQARARYQAGLSTVVEVAEAQRLLAYAEAENAIARLSVWRALLFQAAAAGDLAPFLREVHGTQPPNPGGP